MAKKSKISAGRQFVKIGALAAAVAGLMAGYELVVRPWHLRWGATEEEAASQLPGDELILHPRMSATHAITIQSPVEWVWAWVVQMGQGRGGFYSYDWLENLFGMQIHNVDEVTPDLQHLQVGDTVPFWKGAGVQVVEIEAPRLLVLAGGWNPAGAEEAGQMGGSWTFALSRHNAKATRLIVRTRAADFPPQWLSARFYRWLLEPAHFVMERKMLLGIKEHAERGENLA
ncbi:MAG: hypothetical protein AB1894_25980 [Chloroflexota bacterium]